MRKRLLSLLPYRHVTISTSLTLDEIVNLFSKSIAPRWNPILQAPPSNNKSFQGEVSEQGFCIRMTAYYQGPLTYLVGKFIPDMNGIKIEMYIDPGLGCLALALGGIVGFCFLLRAIAEQSYFAVFVTSIVLIILGASFFFEVDSLDWFIANLLEQHII